MRKPLSAETKAIVKSTAPALQQHGLAITTRMYERLFTDPDVKAMIVDDNMQLQGIVTQTDIIASLITKAVTLNAK